jgi:hypothetical protein
MATPKKKNAYQIERKKSPEECAAESLKKKREKIGYIDADLTYEPKFKALNKLVPIDRNRHH